MKFRIGRVFSSWRTSYFKLSKEPYEPLQAEVEISHGRVSQMSNSFLSDVIIWVTYIGSVEFETKFLMSFNPRSLLESAWIYDEQKRGTDLLQPMFL